MEIKIRKEKKDDVSKPIKPRKKTKKLEEVVVVESINTINDEVEDSSVEENIIPEEIEAINIQSLDWKYEIKEKNTSFYFLLFGISALLIFMAYKYNNWILALIVILGFVMIIQRNSKIEYFRIDEKGIKIQNQEIEWENIDKCGIEALNENALLIAIIPNTFPNLKVYVPFHREEERNVLYLITKYSKLTDAKPNAFDQITKKIMF